MSRLILSVLLLSTLILSAGANIPDKATVGGKYKDLLKTISCPAERKSEEAEHGKFYEEGFVDEVEYCGKDMPAGYWVYVSPNWYIWGKKELPASFAVLSRQVKLSKQTLSLRFEYLKAHKPWAESQLSNLAKALGILEKRTKIPFPGVNPYLVEERPNLIKQELQGMAGPDGMQLASPPDGSPWTMLHEAVHIWNADTKPAWVTEGHANYVSFLLMQELKLKYVGEETYPAMVADWREAQGDEDDQPLEKHYDDIPQGAGKAMTWWAMAHELYGPDFVFQTFVSAIKNHGLSTAQLTQMMRKADKRDPAPLLDGWIRPGKYKVRKSKDFGPLRAPLPAAWP
ncbi:MAG: hypothetical protein ACAI44_15950 [Candidatus Sericytochromatia bacterium]